MERFKASDRTKRKGVIKGMQNMGSAFAVLIVFLICNGIDRLTGWATMARPIVSAPLVGLILGDFQTGIIMGASLESIFMGISAIGGSIPADPLTSTCIAVAYTVLAGADIEAGLALALPIGTIMEGLNSMWKTVLASLAPYWENLAYKGNMRSFRAQMILFGVLIDRLAYISVLFLAIAFGIEGLQAFMGNMPEWFLRGMNAASGMMTGIGFAILTSMIWSKEVGGFFFVGFVLSKYLGLSPLPIAIIAAVVAIMYFFNDKKLIDMKSYVDSYNNKANATTEEDDFF